MDELRQHPARLVLLIDWDPSTREAVQPLLIAHDLELVQARTSVSALELLQRMPERFRLVIVSMEMSELPGAVLLETLRLFRPELPLVCLTAAESATVAAASGNCLPKPVKLSVLRVLLEGALGRYGRLGPAAGSAVTPDAAARAKAVFDVSGNLLEAARELSRGIHDEPASGW
jgi:DNA-binding NtrC family response regulator